MGENENRELPSEHTISIADNQFDLSSEFEAITAEQVDLVFVPENAFADIKPTTNFNMEGSINTTQPSEDNKVEDSGIDIKESKAKKERLLDKRTVDEISFKFNLNEKDTDNLKKLNVSDALNVPFFMQLKEALKQGPSKSKIMDIFNIRKSYTGFHDWYDGNRIDLPNVGMNSIAQNLDYSILLVPIKNNNLNSKQKMIIDNLQADFIEEISQKVLNLIQEDAAKQKPKKVSKEVAPSIIVEMLKNKNESYEDLYINDGEVVDVETIDENEKFVDSNEDQEIIERVVVLDNSITYEQDSESSINTPATNFEMVEMEVTQNPQPNLQQIPLNQQPELMEFDYDDSLELTTYEEAKQVIKTSPLN